MSSEPRPSEIVIEYNRDGNRPTYFPPCDGPTRVYGSQEVVGIRSTIIPLRSGPRPPNSFTAIQQIPGQRICLDVKAKKARITDALNDEKNALIAKQVKDAIERDVNHNWPAGGGGEPDLTYTLHTDEAIHNWLYWMARHVEDGLAVKVQGDLPSSKTLRNGGDIRVAPLADARYVKAEFGGPYLPKTEDTAQLVGAK